MIRNKFDCYDCGLASVLALVALVLTKTLVLFLKGDPVEFPVEAVFMLAGGLYFVWAEEFLAVQNDSLLKENEDLAEDYEIACESIDGLMRQLVAMDRDARRSSEMLQRENRRLIEAFTAREKYATSPAINISCEDLTGEALEGLKNAFNNAREKIIPITSIELAQKSCQWTEGDGYWQIACGYAFSVNDGAPSDNDMKHCCFCGGSILEISAVVENDW